jgi:hypothetical protein
MTNTFTAAILMMPENIAIVHLPVARCTLHM